ncbi:MAG: nuclear transport factor 2 family protein [Desulfobacteraceae bacterium]|nr:nuclear transport factor 2 family protein [Desulfobacteraceae bacterium]MBU4002908.1 nuclear transport factor 2 family protein [Pseudomonadota bacterium]MBU4053354.1 nuclear transport factor 2 family protein [Pseudomonadota bacterium]
MDIYEFARTFISCLETGDRAGARNCYHADAEIWHNFDGVTQTVDENMALFEKLVASTKSRKYVINRLEKIEGGYLQQHILKLETPDGETTKANAIVLVTVDGGKIRRIEEYIDPKPIMKVLTV